MTDDLPAPGRSGALFASEPTRRWRVSREPGPQPIKIGSRAEQANGIAVIGIFGNGTIHAVGRERFSESRRPIVYIGDQGEIRGIGEFLW